MEKHEIYYELEKIETIINELRSCNYGKQYTVKRLSAAKEDIEYLINKLQDDIELENEDKKGSEL